jgi:hypothetical protein
VDGIKPAGGADDCPEFLASGVEFVESDDRGWGGVVHRCWSHQSRNRRRGCQRPVTIAGMSSLESLWSKICPWKRPPSIDRFHVRVVTNPKELEFAEHLPIEIRYVLAVRPARHETFRHLLEQGFGDRCANGG